MTEKWEEISIFADPVTLCGKMSAVPSQAEHPRAKTSESCLKKSQGSANRMPLYLDLTNGATADASWVKGGQLLGEFTMHSFGELPNEGVESRLSQVLETNPPEKYALSAIACRGILNRANRRGKKLPQVLEIALIQQAKRKATD